MPRVLVLEDDNNIRTLLEMILSAAGMAVEAVSTTEAAFASVAKARPDLIVTDSKLHGVEGGVALIQESRRLYPAPLVPAILLSGSTTLLHMIGAQAENFPLVKFMSKPFSVTELMALANKMMVPAAG